MLLIVGGSGYLGGRFSQAMTRAGIKHLISSRRSDLKDPLIRACDFSDIDSVVNALDGITRVLFVAGPGSSHTYKKNDCDLLGLDDEFRIFLSGLAKSQVKDIVYISTIHIYGKNLFGSVDEYTKPLPAIDYGKYHLARENSIIDFSKFNQIWNHGDWVTETSRGGIIVHGRSDSTLNRSGIRIGTSEII